MKIGKTNTGVLISLIGIIAATATLVLFYLFEPPTQILNENDNTSIIDTEPIETDSSIPEDKPDSIDLQPIIDEWASAIGGNRSVLIYDLDRDEVSASYDSTESYETASLYKLFVVYEGYRRLQNGEWDSDDSAGTTGHTIIECLDLAIRESNSLCAETIWKMIGHDELDEIIRNDYGIITSDISHLVSNPEDVAKMLQIYYKHEDITDQDLLSRMWDSFLNQPVTEYDWRQGLPSGFNTATVYNKVGWEFNPDGRYWEIYHDAAIIEFPESLDDMGNSIRPSRHLIVVVMTNHVPYQRIRELGERIEAAIF